MTYNPGDPGHMTAHSSLVADVNAQALRFGLPGDLPTRAEGDEGHLDDHNAIRAKLELIETTAGQAYTTPLPPVRNLGDQGHVTDHDALEACALEAATWPAWNDATGGTITEVDNYNGSGERWRVHTFTGNGTLTVSLAVQPFRVLVIGGGGGGGGTNGPGGGGGQGGRKYLSDAQSLSAGAHTVTIGGGGGGGANQSNGGGGGTSSLGSLSGGGGDGGPGGFAHGQCDAGGPYNTACNKPNISFTSDITGSSATYSQNGCSSCHSGGGSASATQGGNGISSNNFNTAMAGGPGRVFVAYRIG